MHCGSGWNSPSASTYNIDQSVTWSTSCTYLFSNETWKASCNFIVGSSASQYATGIILSRILKGREWWGANLEHDPIPTSSSLASSASTHNPQHETPRMLYANHHNSYACPVLPSNSFYDPHLLLHLIQHIRSNQYHFHWITLVDKSNGLIFKDS